MHRSASDTTAQDYYEERTNSITWHSDVTYEMQPPSTTFLYILDGPVAGGDTLFCNMAVAYRRLSPEFQKRLHGLQAVHSGHEQAEAALARGSIVRRDPVSNIHPIVRTHPVTGEKALFVNPQFVSFFPFSPLFFSFSFLLLLNPHLPDPSHHQFQKRRIRPPAEFPLPTHCARRRYAGASQMGKGDGGRVG